MAFRGFPICCLLLAFSAAVAVGFRSSGAIVPAMHAEGDRGLQQPCSRKALLGTGCAAAAGLLAAAVVGPGLAGADDSGYNLANERIFDTRKLSYLPASPERLIRPGGFFEAGSEHPVVCLGEVHTNPLHHRMQFRTLKALHRSNSGEPLAIGLEMFYKHDQAALDRYVFKHGNMHALKYETSWNANWGYDFNLYSKIFRYARLNQLRLVGLSPPRELRTLVAKRGLESLPGRLRESLPDMDFSDEKHYLRFRDSMKASEAIHGVLSPKALLHFYQAQTLADEHMAEGIAHHVHVHGGRMVVLAGVGHIQGRNGVPDRVQRRLGKAPFTVIPQSVAWTHDGLPQLDNPPGADMGDWVWYTEQELPGLPSSQASGASPRRAA